MAKDTSKAAYHAYRKALFDVGGKSKAQAERETNEEFKRRQKGGKR